MSFFSYIGLKFKSAVSHVSQIFKDFVEKSDHSKSTIFAPLIWMIGILIFAFLATLQLKAEAWISISLMIAAAVVSLIFLVVYLYCLFKHPDLLRTEKFTISKMAIEKSFVGDSRVGIIERNLSDKGQSVLVENIKDE